MHRLQRAFFSKFMCIILTAAIVFTGCSTTQAAGKTEGSKGLEAVEVEALPNGGWQLAASFPDWKGSPDNSLAMNSMVNFEGRHGQGRFYVAPTEGITSFSIYVNEVPVDTSGMEAGKVYEVDYSGIALDGFNSVQVTDILPIASKEKVNLYFTYPEVLDGTLEEAGISEQAVKLISDLIESDIENPIMAIEGNLTIEDGNYSAGVNTYAFLVTIDGYAGNIYIKGGSFNIKNIIINNYGSGEVIITGGEFVSEGSYAEDEWSDAAFMTSSDGKFEINGEDVTVESYYRFLGNKFVDDDEDRGKVVCAQGEIYEEMDWDDDWNEIDYNTYSVCGVDETQDSDDSADGSVSYKLINSNYTIAAGATLSNSSATIIIGEGSTLTICGEYDGPDGSLITEDGGTIVYSCEEEPKPVPASDDLNPNTFDGIESAFATLISSISLLIGLVIERRHF